MLHSGTAHDRLIHILNTAAASLFIHVLALTSDLLNLIMIQHRDQVHITNSNLGPVVNILSIVLIAFAALTIACRLFSKAKIIMKLGQDDYVIMTAMVFYTGQTASTIIAANNGIGVAWHDLQEQQQNKLQKALYASQMLFIPTVAFAKLSVIAFVRELLPLPSSKHFALAFAIFISLWTVASEFAAAFECGLPEVWRLQSGTCFSIISSWTAFNIISILTDFVLILWPSLLIGRVKTTAGRRGFVVLCFACRVLVIGAAIGQVILTTRVEWFHDVSYQFWPVALCTQLVLSLTIITACIPCIQKFLSSTRSGLIRPDDLRRKTQPEKASSGDRAYIPMGSGGSAPAINIDGATKSYEKVWTAPRVN